ncbi:MAG: hypothetical protein K0T99_04740 [Alphaproteobacteria bacterium]|nr:hypothetical protein [Alphaproteobacteria bacterium]
MTSITRNDQKGEVKPKELFIYDPMQPAYMDSLLESLRNSERYNSCGKFFSDTLSKDFIRATMLDDVDKRIVYIISDTGENIITMPSDKEIRQSEEYIRSFDMSVLRIDNALNILEDEYSSWSGFFGCYTEDDITESHLTGNKVVHQEL